MTFENAMSDELERTWEEQPGVIRAFIEVRPRYDELCNEVAYILIKRLDAAHIDYANISNRAKTLKSFVEKISRKDYDDPMADITDLAGVRVVYLYKSDRKNIEDIIEAEFKIIEKIDKIEEVEVDRFGYGALHYLVHLGKRSSGARYDDLKTLKCEIQVRTVLQDAWAIIDHHLVYKQEDDVPKIIKRKLNSLAGLFETADDQFEKIRSEREEYSKAIVAKTSDKSKFLDQEINFDTFSEYLKWKYPVKKPAAGNEHLSSTLATTRKYDFKRLIDIDNLLTRTAKAREALGKTNPAPNAVSEVNRGIAFEHLDFRRRAYRRMLSLFEKHEALLTTAK